MSAELALFPLNIVAFPNESVNLHIFEPRYKQLINDCLNEGSTFGIASYALNKIEYGTEVKVIEVSKKYTDGRMDIKTQGLRVFTVSDFQNPWNNKLYAGGEVAFIENVQDTDLSKLMELKELCSELFTWLGDVQTPDLSGVSSVFDIGHKIGFKIEEEYELLKLTRENERIEYTLKHLKKLIPALERAHSARERIKQNGHFKHLDPLKF
ncbi:MAG: LON peptidase substrate-binding domain-containing protein [Bacteroidota bacterium]